MIDRRMRKDLEMPSRNDFSTRSMFNENKELRNPSNEEPRFFVRKNRILVKSFIFLIL